MIFILQYALVVGGYAATAFLLGNYMKQYTGASDIDLGFIFMIQPSVIFVRPFVCSIADRYQSHRTLYLYCALVSVITHIPFIVIPFIVQYGPVDDEHLLTQRVRFWTLVGCHFIGCVCFSCMRTLGDVLTVNYCKRINSSYTNYRRFGPISFGLCSLILGYINTGSGSQSAVGSMGIPDYVPGFILYTSFHFILALLFYLWPPEFFAIRTDSQLEKLNEAQDKACLPSGRETWQHIRMKFFQLFTFNCRCPPTSSSNKLAAVRIGGQEKSDSNQIGQLPKSRLVDSRQQFQIMLVLMRHDVRIPLFLLLLILGGIVGHSVQNFVYVYLYDVCQKEGCNSSTISGYIMAGICITETFAYTLASWMTSVRHKLIKIQLALLTLALHYAVLAYLVTSSPHFFLIEALHGFEFGLMIATSIESGDLFANEVELIIPELTRRNIVTPRDDLDRIRVSLVATMIACFLLVYDGMGAVIGSLMYGLVVNSFGYSAAFKLNSLLSLLTLFVILCGSLVAKIVKTKPIIRQSATEVANGDQQLAPADTKTTIL